MMAYEPLTLLIAVGFYLTTGSFQVSDIIRADTSAVLWMPGLLVGFMFTAAIKFRKSPFDLSTSHHAHQEMVKGLTTEMSGTTLAIMNIAEYYEMVLLFGIFSLFFINSTWWSWIVAILICGVIFFMENAVGQYQCPCEMEDTPLQLLGGNSGSRRGEYTDPYVGQVSRRQINYE